MLRKDKPRCCVNLSDTRLKRLQSVQRETMTPFQDTVSAKEKVKQWLLHQRAYRMVDISSRLNTACNSQSERKTIPETPMKSITEPSHVAPGTNPSLTGLFTSKKSEAKHGEENESQQLKSSNKVTGHGRLRRFMTPKAKREKRKRYFANKKSQRNKSIDSTTGQPLNDDESLHEQSVYSLENSRSACSSETSYPGKHLHDTLMFQAENIRNVQKQKMDQLERNYGSFVDAQPSFPSDEQKIALPECLSGIERVEMKAKVDELQQNENKALLYARLFRNRCTELQQQVRRLENEKEGIRFFWRNQVLEGQSRAGRMLKIALQK